MPPRIEITPEVAAAARQMYERTLTPVNEICAFMQVSRSVLYARVLEWKWQRRQYSSGDVAVELSAPEPEQAPSAGDAGPAEEPAASDLRAALYARTLRAAELRMTKIERILGTLDPRNAAEAERAARVISSTDRALGNILSLAAPYAPGATDDSEQDQVPRDLDALREELARRINAFVDARRADGGEGGGGNHE